MKTESAMLEKSRDLRKNATRQEKKLWYDFLRTYPIKFRRQYIIGNYIADFYCKEAKLIIELDGSQHYTDEGLLKDQYRTEVLTHKGLFVLRFTNPQVSNQFTAVCRSIDHEVRKRIGNNQANCPYVGNIQSNCPPLSQRKR